MTKFVHPLAGFFLALTLSACSTFDLGSQPNEAINSEAAKLSAPASWVLGGQTDGLLADRWDAVVSDPLMDQYIELALKNNPSLKASYESIARSEAILQQAQSNRLPVIGTNVSTSGGGNLDQFNFSERYSGGLSASWEVDLWGNIVSSTYDLDATKATYENARQALIAAVARAYIAAIESNLLVELSAQTLAAQEETYRIVMIRYELGAASRREVVLAESDVAGARDNLVISEANKRRALLSLEALLGQYPDGDITVAADFPSLPPLFSTGVPTEILRRRPDIVAAEFNALSAFQATRATRANGWPRLSISGGIDTATLNIGNLLDPASIAYSIGAGLADVLFDGGLTEGRINAANASQRSALASYGQTVLDAYFDVVESLNDLRTITERHPYIEKSAESARETLVLAEIQYKEGAIDLLDVLTFRQRSFQADISEISMERQMIDTRIALYLALGGTAFSQAY